MEKEDYKKLNLRNGIDHSVASDTCCEKQSKGKEKKILRWFVLIAVAVVIIFGLRIAVGPTILWADISAYADDKILVTGLTDEDFYVTPEDLSHLELEKVTAVGKSQKAGTVKGVGPTLDTFLAQYGKSREDFKQIKFYADDDYTTALVKTLEEKEIVFSIANGRESLEKGQQPLRIVIPEEDSGKWIRMVTKIEFTVK